MLISYPGSPIQAVPSRQLFPDNLFRFALSGLRQRPVLRYARRRAEIDDPWLRRMLAEKPPKLAAAALANKMARIIRALSVREETYRAPAAAGAASE